MSSAEAIANYHKPGYEVLDFKLDRAIADEIKVRHGGRCTAWGTVSNATWRTRGAASFFRPSGARRRNHHKRLTFLNGWRRQSQHQQAIFR